MSAIAAYHREHGDDYGSEDSRLAKYQAIFSLADFRGKSVLDVGCGEGRFEGHLPEGKYTGIDLLTGQDVLDYHTQHDIVVANGVVYKLPNVGEAAWLIRHMWGLAGEALIFTSLSSWGGPRAGELVLNPAWTIGVCHGLADRIAFRHDYLPGDFCVAMYR